MPTAAQRAGRRATGALLTLLLALALLAASAPPAADADGRAPRAVLTWTQDGRAEFQAGSTRRGTDTYEDEGGGVTLLPLSDRFDHPFSESYLNPDRWIVPGPDPSTGSGAVPETGRVRLTAGNTVAGPSTFGITTTFSTLGDMEIELGYQLLTDWSQEDSARRAGLVLGDLVHGELWLMRGRDTSSLRQPVCGDCYELRDPSGSQASVRLELESPPMSGVLRWRRTGSTVEAWGDGVRLPTSGQQLAGDAPIRVQVRSEAPVYPGASVFITSFHVLRYNGVPDPRYLPSGTFESRTFDTGGPSYFGELSWLATMPPGTSLRFQLAARDRDSGWRDADFVGPDGTAATYFTTSGQLTPPSLGGRRYVRYRAYFEASPDLLFSPALARFSLRYSHDPSDLTPTPTRTSTATSTPTRTLSPTRTATPTRTPRPTYTPTRTRGPLLTRTPSPTRTLTPTRTATRTRSPVPTRTATATRGTPGTRTPTATRAPTGTRIPTRTRPPTITRGPRQQPAT